MDTLSPPQAVTIQLSHAEAVEILEAAPVHINLDTGEPLRPVLASAIEQIAGAIRTPEDEEDERSLLGIV